MRRVRFVRRSRGSATRTMALAFVGGLVAGALLWSTQIRRSRRDLFGTSRWRRLAALGHVAGQPGVESAKLLTEYVRWETVPALRKRGERLLARMTHYLDQG